jgi:hypothetical protein
MDAGSKALVVPMLMVVTVIVTGVCDVVRGAGRCLMGLAQVAIGPFFIVFSYFPMLVVALARGRSLEEFLKDFEEGLAEERMRRQVQTRIRVLRSVLEES